MIDDLRIYAADPASARFEWASSHHKAGTRSDRLLDAIASDLSADRPVALGFVGNFSVHVQPELSPPLAARVVLDTLACLRALRTRATAPGFLDVSAFLTAPGPRLLLWHVGNPELRESIVALGSALSQPSIDTQRGEVISMLGVLLLKTGWTSDVGVLGVQPWSSTLLEAPAPGWRPEDAHFVDYLVGKAIEAWVRAPKNRRVLGAPKNMVDAEPSPPMSEEPAMTPRRQQRSCPETPPLARYADEAKP